MKYKIIYVCYSNKGRSPAFEVYTRHFLRTWGVTNITVKSAASSKEMVDSLRKRGSEHVSRTTNQILKEHGLGLDKHTVNYLGEIISGSDLILAVDQYTLDSILKDFDSYKERMMLAGDYAKVRQHREIFGPHHSLRGTLKSEVDGYRKMIDEIRYVSRRAARKMIREMKEGVLSRRV